MGKTFSSNGIVEEELTRASVHHLLTHDMAIHEIHPGVQQTAFGGGRGWVGIGELSEGVPVSREGSLMIGIGMSEGVIVRQIEGGGRIVLRSWGKTSAPAWLVK